MTAKPLGETMNPAAVSGINKVTHRIETALRFIQPYRMTTAIFYGDMNDDLPIRSHNIGDSSKIAGGYIVEDPSLLDIDVKNPEIFTVDELGHIRPVHVGTGAMTVSIAGCTPATITIEVRPRLGYAVDDTGELVPVIKVSLPVTEYAYTGAPVEPDLIITDYYGRRLLKDIDYYLLYANNIGPTSSASVSAYPVKGGNYDAGSGVQLGSAQFSIVKPDVSTTPDTNVSDSGNPSVGPDEGGESGSEGGQQHGTGSGNVQQSGGLSAEGNQQSSGTGDGAGQQTGEGNGSSQQAPSKKGLSVTLAKTKLTYTGKALKPQVKVYYSGKKLAKKNYSVSYKNNKNIGTATVTIKGKGKYKSAEAKATFQIKPVTVKKTSLSKVKSTKKARVDVQWKKGKDAGGYQIQYSTNKNFKKDNKLKTIKGGKKTSCTVSGLKSRKTYYVRIRAYKKVGGKTWYSAWSGKKKIKVK